MSHIHTSPKQKKHKKKHDHHHDEIDEKDLNLLIRDKKQKFWDAKAIRFLIMFLMTFLFMLAEIITGVWTGSLALISDSFHMTSDAIALVIGFVALQLAKNPASKTYSFGWSRAEIIGSLINGVFLLAVCFFILTESVQRFIEVEKVENPMWVVVVGSAGLVVNLIGLFLFADVAHGHSHSDGGHGHAHGDHSEEETSGHSDSSHSHSDHEGHNHSHHKKQTGSNTNTQAVFLHILGDLLGSVGAVGSGLCILLFDFDFRYYFDPIASLLIAVIIFITAAPLVVKCVKMLMQSVPAHINLENLKGDLKEVQGVVDVHDLHVWQLIENKLIGTVHVVCINNTPFMRIADRLKKVFHKYGIHSSTIQPEFVSISRLQEPWESCQLQCDQGGECDPCCGPSQGIPLNEEDIDRLGLIEFSSTTSDL